MTLPENSNIFASEYSFYLPDKKLLQKELQEWIEEETEGEWSCNSNIENSRQTRQKPHKSRGASWFSLARKWVFTGGTASISTEDMTPSAWQGEQLCGRQYGASEDMIGGRWTGEEDNFDSTTMWARCFKPSGRAVLYCFFKLPSEKERFLLTFRR